MSDATVARGTIRLEGDSTDLDNTITQAGRTIDGLGQKGATAGKKVSDGLKQAGAGATEAAGKIDAAGRRTVSALEREAAQVGRTRAEYLEWLAARRGVTTEAAPFIAKIREAEKALQSHGDQLNKTGISAKQFQAALRGTPAQLTDIVVSLQGGQAPLTVLLQQGGQLKDMFGGVVPAVKGLATATLSLINPYTIAAAAMGALALVYNQGANEQQRFANGLALTGNYAGTTASQLSDMAQEIGNSVGSQRAAADALGQLVETGQLGGPALESMARSAVAASEGLGKAVKDTVADFVKLRQDPVKAIEELNGKYHFLTAAVYEQILALTEEGRKNEAAALAQRTYAAALETMSTKAKANLGTLESAWSSLGKIARWAWDGMLNIGRESTLTDTITAAEAKLKQLQDGAYERGAARRVAQVEEQRKLLEGLYAQRDKAGKDAAAQGSNTKRDEAGIEWAKQSLEYRTKAQKVEAEIATARALGVAAGKSEAEIQERIAQIRAKNQTKNAGAGQIQKADLAFDVADIQARYSIATSAASTAERTLDAVRAAGLISERDYYSQKRAFITANAETQQAALKEENARLQADKATGADRINNDRKIAQNTAKMAEIRVKASADVAISTLQEEAANTRLAQSYLQAQQAAQDFLAATSARYQRELAGAGRGSLWRDQNAATNQINDRYQAQRDELRNNRSLLELAGQWNAQAQQQYDRRLEIINSANGQALVLDAKYWKDKIALQDNWQVGAQEALANYADLARDRAGQVGNALTNSLRGAEDAAVQFARTGKLSIGSFADTVINEFLRIQARTAIAKGGNALMGGLASLLPSVFGSFSSNWSSTNTANPWSLSSMGLDKNAKGGVYQSPSLSSYSDQVVNRPTLFAFAKGAGLMGEAGPEAIMPLTRTPSGSLGVRAIGGAAGGIKVEVYNNGQPVRATATSIQQPDGTQLIRMVLDAVGESIADGVGAVPRAMEGRYGLQRNMGY
ncbi:phage tail tape measure protein [Pigmentiphaga litoralis]|uniref:phage tail tape measure protein n=1 Tax=Pigmentiphaga litoralis TaxID=516702 RepID=UPI0016794AD5|nr:phage tail tape measure protein [Pigmentiphaga litoralis]GGX32821.1 phage tail tape measure protein [Pigmentiphaga litoralis]